MMVLWRRSGNYTVMDLQQKMTTQKHYKHINRIWLRLRVAKGMRLLHMMIIIFTTSTGSYTAIQTQIQWVRVIIRIGLGGHYFIQSIIYLSSHRSTEQLKPLEQ